MICVCVCVYVDVCVCEIISTFLSALMISSSLIGWILKNCLQAQRRKSEENKLKLKITSWVKKDKFKALRIKVKS